MFKLFWEVTKNAKTCSHVFEFSSICHFGICFLLLMWIIRSPGHSLAPVALSDWQHHLTPLEDVTDTAAPHNQEEVCWDQHHPSQSPTQKGSSVSSPENSMSLLMCRTSRDLHHSRPVKTYFVSKWLGSMFVSHSKRAKFWDLIFFNVHIYTHIRLWGCN